MPAIVFRSAILTCLFHSAYLWLLGDKVITLFYNRNHEFILLSEHLVSALTMYAGYACISLSFGLSLPLKDNIQRQGYALFLTILLLPAFILLTQLYITPCLHKPGYAASACVKDDHIHLVRQQVLLVRIALPVITAAIASLFGIILSRLDPTPMEDRISAPIRVFYFVTGGFIFLYGLGCALEQKFQIASKFARDIILIEGWAAIPPGIVLAFLGIGILRASITNVPPTHLLKRLGKYRH